MSKPFWEKDAPKDAKKRALSVKGVKIAKAKADRKSTRLNSSHSQ